ncbi:glycoside hydrolase family 38 C-terminal domain-containing protein [Streptomyces sp. BE147]|uniref:alpha-mannosidase n=1 Tax=Streptomyces sp. BE147 TaxID=3002524 RepID=UPI002E765456|nr:glycoside hydrolase family 38 C-terminal domain-containing protein [Streptomyces sp. BE147]MEE1742535.1 glycoside hydrolase family 38 C-terminal domain-containing protein [Streptomyces sp. BE147]
MHDDRTLTEERLDRVLRERIRPAIHPRTAPLDIEVWHAPGEPVPFTEAVNAPYKPGAIGDTWGPAWGTSWFRVTGRVPADWAGLTVEAVIDLGFARDRPGFSAEALAHRPDGSVVKALNPCNTWLRVGQPAAGGEEFTYYLEAAANPEILEGVSDLGDRETAGSEPLYRVERMDLAVFDEQVWELVQDLEVLDQLMRQLPLGSARRWEILRAVERCLDALDLDAVNATAAAARERLRAVLDSPANASAHRLSAVGHAHIDSAWLWPLRETVRKVTRTTSNVVALMDDHPEFVFAMSQAQQLDWLREHQPALYERVKEKAAAGQFVPVGGMWVESDTNMPGSEALARQFVYGKRFFLEEFGVETREVWLPDSFGYSAALPQLVALSGSRWFLTQKISWNTTNPFPHHSFLWEGLDGTRVFTHFPPVDTYVGELSGQEMAHAEENFRDKGNATRSLVPFGWGDGGGGPTREMLARAERLADLEGSSRVTIETPAEFFAAAEAEYTRPPVWLGELYLELHRGTYTSQARTKQGNRRSEHLLREAELWAATAAVRTGFRYPQEELDRIWKSVLLHQFHDILPGSSIAWVHREAEATYARIAEELEAVIGGAQRALAGSPEGGGTVVFNAAPHSRAGVPAGGGALVREAADGPVGIESYEGGFRLDNGLLRVTVDARGLVVSVLDLVAGGRETVAPGSVANLLQIHPDLPNRWDAWDVDSFYRNTVTDLTEADSVRRVGEGVEVVRSFGGSRVTQLLTLRAGARRLDIDTEVDWHEQEKFLKAAFPLDVRAGHSTAETQFGHVQRPTHTNTSWEAAKFEICAHRFLHVGEPGWGAALVNDSTYGHDVTRTVREDGATTTTVRLSLLRAPRYPDPATDQGVHRLRYALLPGATVGDAVREGWQFSLPERRVRGGREVAPLVTLDSDAVVATAVKLADDGSGDVVVRVHEAHGGRAAARLGAGFPLASATVTDLLERPLEGERVTVQGDVVELVLRPFQILTLRLAVAAAG